MQHTQRKSATLKSAALLLLASAVSSAVSSAAYAEWTLDGDASSFYYVTSKASAISEVNSFSGLSGSIAEDGTATLAIDLTTVNTAIEVRDQRMREIAFQVTDFPEATVMVTVDTDALEGMKPGSIATGSYTATVELHGMSQELPAELQLVKLDASTVQVQLARPLIVSAAAFGLTAGVEQLREVAGLPAINPNVVVDFTLLYRNQ